LAVPLKPTLTLSPMAKNRWANQQQVTDPSEIEA
jgi:hypothetical protein